MDPNRVSYVEPDCYPYRSTFGYPVSYVDANLHGTASPAADFHTPDPHEHCGA